MSAGVLSLYRRTSQLKVIRELRARIKRAFDEAGIEIPFAQRTVWHRTGDRAVAVLPRSTED